MKASCPYFGTGTAALKAFLEDLGVETVMPPAHTRRTLELGVRHSPEQICLPFKITLGNLIEAAELGADTLFMAAGTRKCRFGYYHLVQERVLTELFPHVRLYGLCQYSAFEFIFRKLPEIFGVSRARSLRAVTMLFARTALIHDLDNMVRRLRSVDFAGAERFARTGHAAVGRTQDQADVRRTRYELTVEFRRLMRAGARDRLRIGLVGEVFMMVEPFANWEIEKELGRLGIEVVSERSLYRHLRHMIRSDVEYLRVARNARRYIGESPGGEVTKTLGEAVQFSRDGVDGIIHIFPFTCMPENMALEILQQISRDHGVPVMSISFDEHTGKVGLITRLEAFTDMLARRQRVCA